MNEFNFEIYKFYLIYKFKLEIVNQYYLNCVYIFKFKRRLKVYKYYNVNTNVLLMLEILKVNF